MSKLQNVAHNVAPTQPNARKFSIFINIHNLIMNFDFFKKLLFG
jgi:hypothetical protein